MASHYKTLRHQDRHLIPSKPGRLNTLRPRQNGRHFADDIFNFIFLNENIWIPIKISLKFVPIDPINNIPALVQIMAWRRPGDKPLSELMMVNLLTHICVTRPHWVKACYIPMQNLQFTKCKDIYKPRLTLIPRILFNINRNQVSYISFIKGTNSDKIEENATEISRIPPYRNMSYYVKCRRVKV